MFLLKWFVTENRNERSQRLRQGRGSKIVDLCAESSADSWAAGAGGRGLMSGVRGTGPLSAATAVPSGVSLLR